MGISSRRSRSGGISAGMEAIEQGLTEPPRFDLLFQIPIGRGHDANIDDVGD